jgi:trimethylamine---corrinoid protein Co-methyltransferase
MARARTDHERLFGSVCVLSEEEIERTVSGSLEILETTGVRFDDPSARAALTDAGALATGSIVRIPREMVTSCLAQLPAEVVLEARNPDQSLLMGRNRFLTTNGFGTVSILDPQSGERRPSTAADLARLTRLADRLETVSYCQHQTTAQDVPAEQLDVLQAFAVLANTSKHCHLSTYSAQHIDAVLELGRIASESAPRAVFSLGCCSLSPLRFPMESTQVLARAVQDRIPFLVVCGAIGGVMAPVTLAGTLVVQTAEHLAAVVLAQTLQPQAPILLGSFSSPMDPRTGMQRLAAAELTLINGATAQICRRLGLPFGYGTGGVSDASTAGVQAGIEKALTTLGCALAGVEVIHDAVSGILASGMITCYEQMLIDAEMCQLVRRYVRGIEVSDETMALASIAEVGPAGSFLAHRHTAKHVRSEILLSDLWDSGRQDGHRSVVHTARTRVDELLQSGERTLPLSASQIEAMVDVCRTEGLCESMVRSLVTADEERPGRRGDG